ncbi:MAG: LLM class flavin-dependent oxidoreductase [Gammaproteobacteria bacterium]|nr:LLM class flavin-dependent oxidoreductase [Gammaproteobacteria bacterium]
MTPPKILLILSENWTLTDGQDLGSLIDWAVLAERAGIWGVMLSEHICLGPSAGSKGREANERAYMAPGNQDPATPWPSSMLLHAAIASRTTTLRLACCAIIAPLRHPVDLAKQLATLDCLSQGRVIVQPTVSWHKDEYDCLGVDFRRRGMLLDEHLRAWQLLWAESPASFEGDHYRFHDCYCDPKPCRPGGPELWFGGQSLSKPLLRRLIEYGSGFHPFGPPSVEDMRTLKTELEAASKDFDAFPKIGGIRANFTSDNAPANLRDSMASIPPQMQKGFDTFCVKPNQFIDDAAEMGRFLDELVTSFDKL